MSSLVSSYCVNEPAHVLTLDLDVCTRVCDRIPADQARKETYELRARTGACLWGLLGDVPVLAGLRGVEPTTDAQPCVPLFIHDDFLDGMKTLSGLDLEKDELVPARWD